MDEKTTNELNHILKSCTTLSHLEAALTELPEKERLTLKCYLEELLETKGLNKADVIREANIARTYGYQIFQGERLASRDKLIALSAAMHLTLQECNRLLKIAKAGILYSKNRRDANCHLLTSMNCFMRWGKMCWNELVQLLALFRIPIFSIC